jgi:hypothetical protein
VLHCAWCREWCRSSRYWEGQGGSGRYERRAYRLVSRAAREQAGRKVTALGRLITRRSQVQILPPPPTNMQVSAGPGPHRTGADLVFGPSGAGFGADIANSRRERGAVQPEGRAFRSLSAASSCRRVPVAPAACRSVPRVDRAGGADDEGRRSRIGPITRRSPVAASDRRVKCRVENAAFADSQLDSAATIDERSVRSLRSSEHFERNHDQRSAYADSSADSP